MTHKRRPARTQPNDSANQVGRCTVCEKPMYLTKRAARRAAGQALSKWGTGGTPYKCGDYWHF